MTAETSAAAPAAPTSPASLLARGHAVAWGDAGAIATRSDFWLPDRARLDDRTRSAMIERLRTVISGITEAIIARTHAAPAATSAVDPGVAVFDRLQDSGLLDDDDLMADIGAQVREELLGDALATNRQPDSPPLLVPRLARCEDPSIAAAAEAYLVAENARHAAERADGIRGEVRERLIWCCAAALRALPASALRSPPTDTALADAARSLLTNGQRQNTLAANAERLAAAIDARGAELPGLLIEALEEGRVALFAALLAHAQRIGFAAARSLVLDPDGTGLWLALRALDIDRGAIARIAVALAHAEPRRDLEAFADVLDVLASLTPRAAGESLAPLALDPAFRAAVRMIDRAAR